MVLQEGGGSGLCTAERNLFHPSKGKPHGCVRGIHEPLRRLDANLFDPQTGNSFDAWPAQVTDAGTNRKCREGERDGHVYGEGIHFVDDRAELASQRNELDLKASHLET